MTEPIEELSYLDKVEQIDQKIKSIKKLLTIDDLMEYGATASVNSQPTATEQKTSKNTN